MRQNPVYWQELNSPLRWSSDGYVALWARVIEDAITAAGDETQSEAAHDARRLAIRFLESELFRDLCTECSIDPEAAIRSIHRRLYRTDKNKIARRRVQHGPGNVSS